jgi:hypothetical protein
VATNATVEADAKTDAAARLERRRLRRRSGAKVKPRGSGTVYFLLKKVYFLFRFFRKRNKDISEGIRISLET